jgi:hypothetical protein
LAGEVDEPAAELLDRGGAEAVVGPVTEPLALNQTGIAQDAQVVADQWLWCIERLDQVTDTELLFGQEREYPPPQGLSRRPKPIQSSGGI